MMKKKLKIITSILLAAIVFGACTPSAQESTQQIEDISLQITQVDTSNFPIVDVYVSATDREGNPFAVPVNGIQLFEDGTPIRDASIHGRDAVTSFTSLLLIDNSGSMEFSEKINNAKQASAAYIEQMRGADSAGIISYNTDIVTVQEITQNKQALLENVQTIEAVGNTAMWDALMASIQALNPLQGRKAILLMTDGMDNESSATPDDVLAAIGDSGLSISTIGLGTKPEEDAEPDLYEGIDESTLSMLAEQTGGAYTYVEDPSTLTAIYTKTSQALQSEVVIRYQTPQALRDGVRRSLTVELTSNWQNQVAGSENVYNPGGLIPEIPDPDNWTLFLILLGVLLLGLIVPLIVIQVKKRKKKKKIRIVLKD